MCEYNYGFSGKTKEEIIRQLYAYLGSSVPSDREEAPLRTPEQRKRARVFLAILYNDRLEIANGRPVIVCPYCHTAVLLEDMSIDHRVPRGGKGSKGKRILRRYENLAPTCPVCNGDKDCQTRAFFCSRLGRYVEVV
jgi:hypothetical protein